MQCRSGSSAATGCKAAAAAAIRLNIAKFLQNGLTTTVSYRYQSDGPEAYGLYRIACIGGSCTSARVLSDLSPPIDGLGNPIAWAPGQAVPTNIIAVDVPSAIGPVEAGDENADDSARLTARRYSETPAPVRASRRPSP